MWKTMLRIAANPISRSTIAVIKVSDGIGAFSVNEARRFHGVSRMAKAEHKLHVVDDAADQHEDAEDDERDAEVARGAGVRERACITKL
jgi:predicted transposase YbfD/YdcC